MPDGVALAAFAVPLAAWLLAEVALLRALLRPLPAQGADVPVDEALRTWTAHLVTAAASVLALLPLGALLLAAGIDPDRVSEGLDLLPVTLVAGGFSALAAGLAVAGVPADLAAAGAGERAGTGRLTAAGFDTRRPSRCTAPAVVYCDVGHRDRRHFPRRLSSISRHVRHRGCRRAHSGRLRASGSLAVHSCQSHRVRYRVVTDSRGGDRPGRRHRPGAFAPGRTAVRAGHATGGPSTDGAPVLLPGFCDPMEVLCAARSSSACSPSSSWD